MIAAWKDRKFAKSENDKINKVSKNVMKLKIIMLIQTSKTIEKLLPEL